MTSTLTPDLQYPTHSTDSFTYHADGNLLVTEASTLGPNYGARLYSDACDFGFGVRSARTGRKVIFVLAHQERDSEGELQYEDYKPADTTLWAAGTVRIFND